MTLTSKRYEKFYETSGSGADKIDTKKLTDATNAWATEKAEGCKKYLNDPILAPLIYQLQQMQDEIDYLRTEIALNKAKDPIPKPNSTTVTFSEILFNKGAYSIRLTASRDFGGKTGVVTKSIDLKLI
tara:strand:+ start:162 stop:545 length:384 start_codon:yes stop_codon:yes gene_type:complete